MTNVRYNEDIHHMTHPTVVRCVLFITSSHYHLHQLEASKPWRETSPGNRNTKYRSIKHFPCLPSTPSGPYADWRGFTMILSRDFNTIHTRIILSFSIQIQTFFVSSSRRVEWGDPRQMTSRSLRAVKYDWWERRIIQSADNIIQALISIDRV